MAGQGKAGQSRWAEQSRAAGKGRAAGQGRAAEHILQNGCTRHKRESKDRLGSSNFNSVYHILEYKYLQGLFVLRLYVGCSGLLISLQINISK